MFRWSSNLNGVVLNPESANDVIPLEESGTLSLDDLVNQLSNVFHPATWKNSNFRLVNISVFTSGSQPLLWGPQVLPEKP